MNLNILEWFLCGCHPSPPSYQQVTHGLPLDDVSMLALAAWSKRQTASPPTALGWSAGPYAITSCIPNTKQLDGKGLGEYPGSFGVLVGWATGDHIQDCCTRAACPKSHQIQGEDVGDGLGGGEMREPFMGSLSSLTFFAELCRDWMIMEWCGNSMCVVNWKHQNA